MAAILPVTRALVLLAQIGITPAAPIVIVHEPARGNAAIAHNAYALDGRIYINDAGQSFDGAKTDPIVLAGILAHESFHIEHGNAERPAYAYQIIVLQQLHAPHRLIADVAHTMTVVAW